MTTIETNDNDNDNDCSENENEYGRAFDPEAETVSDDWVGALIYTSWGYGQTNTEIAQIIDVSDSGKSVKARMVSPKRTATDRTSETLDADETAAQFGDEFRLYVRFYRDRPSFRGSYPFIRGDFENGKRLDSFLPYKGGGLYQTAPNHGH